MATLGISTNTRLLGMAIIHQNDLVAYSIRLHKSPWSAAKANKIVTSLEPCVRRYCIKKVVLSIPYAHHQTKEFKILISRICAYCKVNDIALHTEPPEMFHSFRKVGEKKTKKALMESLVARFPELRCCYNKELRNKSKYYIKLFEAVAVAAFSEQKQS